MTPRIRLLVNVLLFLALACAISLAVIGWYELPTSHVWGRLLMGAGVGGVIGIGIMFLLPIELRANLTFMGVAVLGTLWIASWVLYEPRLRPRDQRQQEYAAAARAAGVPFDARTSLQVLDDLRRSGVDAGTTLSAWVFFGPQSDLDGGALDAVLRDGEPPIVPLAGRSRATTVVCNEQGEYLIVETDRYGYNNPDDVYEANAPVLILGDSYAFGYCVPPGHDIGSLLRAADLDVVNLGYPGAGPLIQLAQLREYGPVVQPSVVLWLYYHGNDRVNLSRQYSYPALRRYLHADHRANLPDRQNEIDAFWGEYVEQVVARGHPSSRPSLGHILLLQPLSVAPGQPSGSRSRGAPVAPADPAVRGITRCDHCRDREVGSCALLRLPADLPPVRRRERG